MEMTNIATLAQHTLFNGNRILGFSDFCQLYYENSVNSPSCSLIINF